MKAHELAKMLLEGPDVSVYVAGYEGGINDVNELETVQVRRDYYKSDYFGKHDIVYNDPSDDIETGIILQFTE